MGRFGLSDLGIGVGLRIPHYPYLAAEWPTVPWFEVITENFLVDVDDISDGRSFFNTSS